LPDRERGESPFAELLLKGDLSGSSTRLSEPQFAKQVGSSLSPPSSFMHVRTPRPDSGLSAQRPLERPSSRHGVREIVQDLDLVFAPPTSDALSPPFSACAGATNYAYTRHLRGPPVDYERPRMKPSSSCYARENPFSPPFSPSSGSRPKGPPLHLSPNGTFGQATISSLLTSSVRARKVPTGFLPRPTFASQVLYGEEIPFSPRDPSSDKWSSIRTGKSSHSAILSLRECSPVYPSYR